LKHSRRNLHRRREGGAKPGHFLTKALFKVAKEYDKQKKITEERAKYEILGQKAIEIRDKFGPSRRTFSARPSSSSNQITLGPSTASAASAAPTAFARFSTALPAGISKGKLYVPEGMVMVAPTRYFSSMGKKLSSRKESFTSDTNHK
jgi:hypothetical protein